MRWRIAGAILLAAALLPGRVMAETIYGFETVSNNIAGDVTIGEAQLFVGVSGTSNPNQVAFRFFNIGPAAASITDVYFDDGTLLGIASITNMLGVDFSQDADPGDLPSGNPDFEATAGFTADSNPPAQPNGVNPFEELTITFDLINGKTLADTLAALDGGVDLKIGIHVQGFATGGSESFVNGDGNPTGVPLPAAALAGSALMGTLGLRRPSRRQ
jgi:hypothetical protein